MKFDKKWRNGQTPPYSDSRHAFIYQEEQLECNNCKTPTRWIHIAKLIPICSDECLTDTIIACNKERGGNKP